MRPILNRLRGRGLPAIRGWRRAGWLLALLIGVACGPGEADRTARRDSRTPRERDSAIAASKLPGAPAVRRALDAADSAAARAARMDSTAGR